MKNYRLGVYEKSMPSSLSLNRKLMRAKEAGFDYLELSIDETDEKLARLDWSDQEINLLRRESETVEIPINSICLSAHRRFPLGDPDAAARRQSLEIMRKACVLAGKLGVRIIQLAGYDVYYKQGNAETAKLFGESLKKAAGFAAQCGVTLAFETMETPFMDTVEKALVWVNKVKSPWLQIYPDIGNLTNAALKYGHNVLDDLKKGTGHLSALHLKETRPGIYREVPYGEGHVDFKTAIKTALNLGVRLFVGEFWCVKDGKELPDWKATLAKNSAFLRAFFP
jgi:predicted hexulose-6-phosphate isomerase